MEFYACSRSLSISSREIDWRAIASSLFFTRWVLGRCLERSSSFQLVFFFVNELFSDVDYIASTVWVHYQFSVLWNFARQPENYHFFLFITTSDIRTHPSSINIIYVLTLSFVLLFADTLNDFIEVQVQLASIDVLAACKKSLAHGPLLLARYDCFFSTTQNSLGEDTM